MACVWVCFCFIIVLLLFFFVSLLTQKYWLFEPIALFGHTYQKWSKIQEERLSAHNHWANSITLSRFQLFSLICIKLYSHIWAAFWIFFSSSATPHETFCENSIESYPAAIWIFSYWILIRNLDSFAWHKKFKQNLKRNSVWTIDEIRWFFSSLQMTKKRKKKSFYYYCQWVLRKFWKNSNTSWISPLLSYLTSLKFKLTYYLYLHTDKNTYTQFTTTQNSCWWFFSVAHNICCVLWEFFKRLLIRAQTLFTNFVCVFKNKTSESYFSYFSHKSTCFQDNSQLEMRSEQEFCDIQYMYHTKKIMPFQIQLDCTQFGNISAISVTKEYRFVMLYRYVLGFSFIFLCELKNEIRLFWTFKSRSMQSKQSFPRKFFIMQFLLPIWPIIYKISQQILWDW